MLICFLVPSQSLFAASVRCADAIKIETEVDDLGSPRPIVDNIDNISLPSVKDLEVAAKALILSLENHYGPLQLKKDTIQLRWKEAKRQFYLDIRECKTHSEVLRVISRFLLGLNDAHVSVTLPSSYEASLPLQFNYIPRTESMHLTYINPILASLRLRSGELPPLGAELVKINSQNVFEYQKKFPSFNADGNTLTNRAQYARSLSRLREARGFPLSNIKDVNWKFTFRWLDPQTQKIVEKDSVFEYITQGLPLIDIASTPPKKVEPIKPTVEQLLPALNRKTPEGKVFTLRQSVPLFDLPKDFQRIEWPDRMKNLFDENRLMAGVFQHNGKRVGILRVATYDTSGYNFIGIKQVVDHLIRQLQMKTDYLILDQMSNPGGAVVYSDMIVEALVGKLDPKIHMRFKLKPNQNFVRKYAETINLLENTPILPPSQDKENLIIFLRDQYEKVHRAFRTGEPLTEPVSLMGDYAALKLEMAASETPTKQLDLFSSISDPQYSYGEKAIYRKPVFMLIDHFSYSGGDATPANLQDYGRVRLIGTRTAGAGGTVENFSHQILDIQFSYALTTSLMYRPTADQKYVENYGVTPHHIVEPSLKDYLTGFKDYFDQVMKIAESEYENAPRLQN